MKRTIAVLVFQLLGLTIAAGAQEKVAAPQHKMIEFHMALLKRGPAWTGEMTPETNKLETAQENYATYLVESGKGVIIGRLTDDGEIRGVYVLRATSAGEAKEWAESSPGVKSGLLVAEMHPWWSEEVMKKTATPEKFTTAYLAFLTRGAKWTPEKTPQIEEIQKAHLANIGRLAETGKLVVAGPFGDDGTLRGIFVFKVATLAEAKALAETDPAVQASRLVLDIHPWLVPEGILP